MADKPNFRDPVFVRNDDTTTIRASVIEWNDALAESGALSVRLQGMDESILINAADWPILVGCINRELERLA
jgi:hypothetical protein